MPSFATPPMPAAPRMGRIMKSIKTARGVMSEHHNCIDCGVNTAPGWETRERIDEMLRAGYLRADPDHLGKCIFGEHTEIYIVHNKVWADAGMEGYGGCLCIGCLEARLRRKLRPKDFPRSHPFSRMPGSERLLDRRGEL